MPAGQSEGGISLQRSPRLNQPPVVGRQERQPDRLAATSVIKLSNISFFMALLPIGPVGWVGLYSGSRLDGPPECGGANNLTAAPGGATRTLGDLSRKA